MGTVLIYLNSLETPAEVIAAADKVVITGSDAPLLRSSIHCVFRPYEFCTHCPCFPAAIPWKFADAISALKGLEGAWGEVLASERYGQKAQSVSLDSDAATLFVFAAFGKYHNSAPDSVQTSGFGFDVISYISCIS